MTRTQTHLSRDTAEAMPFVPQARGFRDTRFVNGGPVNPFDDSLECFGFLGGVEPNELGKDFDTLGATDMKRPCWLAVLETPYAPFTPFHSESRQIYLTGVHQHEIRVRDREAIGSVPVVFVAGPERGRPFPIEEAAQPASHEIFGFFPHVLLSNDAMNPLGGY